MITVNCLHSRIVSSCLSLRPASRLTALVILPGLITTDKKAVFAGFDPSSCIETPVVNSWVALEITTVLNPAQFYAIFPFGTKPIPEISEDEKYKNGKWIRE